MGRSMVQRCECDEGLEAEAAYVAWPNKTETSKVLGGFDGSMMDFCIKPFEICLYIFCYSRFMSFQLNSSVWIAEFFSVATKKPTAPAVYARGQIFQGLEVHNWD